MYVVSPLSSLHSLTHNSYSVQIGAMVDALEHTITAFQTSTVSESAKKDTLPFKFQWGKSTHVGFLIYDTPIVTAHHPFIFYAFIFLASGLGNTTLWLAGFKYYGKRRSVSPISLLCALDGTDERGW
jgi:hypothetical protein